jgi:hypothetical protein
VKFQRRNRGIKDGVQKNFLIFVMPPIIFRLPLSFFILRIRREYFLHAILYTVFEIVNYAKLTVKVEIHKVKRNDIILKCRTKRSLNNI